MATKAGTLRWLLAGQFRKVAHHTPVAEEALGERVAQLKLKV